MLRSRLQVVVQPLSTTRRRCRKWCATTEDLDADFPIPGTDIALNSSSRTWQAPVVPVPVPHSSSNENGAITQPHTGCLTHIVQSGRSCSSTAQENGTTTDQIITNNPDVILIASICWLARILSPFTAPVSCTFAYKRDWTVFLPPSCVRSGR
jgi:hypothetical protein